MHSPKILSIEHSCNDQALYSKLDVQLGLAPMVNNYCRLALLYRRKFWRVYEYWNQIPTHYMRKGNSGKNLTLIEKKKQ